MRRLLLTALTMSGCINFDQLEGDALDAGGFFGGMAAIWLMFVPLIGSSLFLVIYSYVLYRGETKA